MVARKRLKKRRYWIALVLSLFLFSFGFLLGYWAVDAKINYLVDTSTDLKLDSFDFGVQRDLIDLYPCNYFSAAVLEDSLTEMGEDIGKVENTAGFDNARLIYMKNYYSLLELKHWLFLSKFDQVCGKSHLPVFYFYSNDEEVCVDCEVQGYLLQTMRLQHPKLRVYSFDERVTVDSVNIIRNNYNITTLPAMVIGDEVYNGYVSYDELEVILKSKGLF